MVIKWLKQQGYNTIDESYRAYITRWGQWYKGRVPSIHNYIQFNGAQRLRRCRKTLGMAKRICEDWANLLLNEKVQITASDDVANDIIAKDLERNHFSIYGNQLIEKAFAFGTGAFVEYYDEGNIIDYITAQNIYPLTWDNGDITECAFASERKDGDDKYIYLNIHRLEGGLYVIENHLLKVGKSKSSLTEVSLPEGLEPVFNTGSSVPRFQIIYPNIANNIDLDSPLGVSVYANALDQLETCDVIYDSFYNEFNLGRKRIMIPMSMARIMLQNDGETIPVFDENDLCFYAYQTDDKSQRIEEMNGELRTAAHIDALSEAVNMTAYKCGLGEHKYKFNGSGVKTATEVVSEDSEMFRSVRKHEAVIASAITGLYKALADMNGLSTEFDVHIDFDDSIIEDTDAERTRDRQDVLDGIMSKAEYRVKWYGETAQQAEMAVQGIQSMDAIMGF